MGNEHEHRVATDSQTAVTVAKPVITGLPDTYDVGSQIVDSERVFDVGTPMFLDPNGGRARASATITDHFSARAFSTDWPAWHDVDSRRPLAVRFAPATDGQFEAALDFTVSWSEGIEKRPVLLTGRARDLDDVPEQPVAAQPEVAVQQHGARGDREVPQRLDQAAGQAKAAAAGLARAHRDGLTTAQQKVSSFKAAPAPSLLEQLAELAVLAAVSGVAGAFSGFLAARLATWVVGSITTPSSNSGVVKGIAAAMSTAINGTARALMPSSHQPAILDERSNLVIEFFDRQRGLLRDAEKAYALSVVDQEAHLQALAETDPTAALNAMEAITASFEEVLPNADVLQRLASELQWTDGIAQRELGTQTIATANGKQTVSRIADKRDARHSLKGVLEIQLRLTSGTAPIEEGAFEMTRASIDGVSQEVAGDLRDVELATAGIPMRIIVHGPPDAVITRDEAGRVRMSGFLITRDQDAIRSDAARWSEEENLLVAKRSSEAQMHAAAEKLVARVLKKTLNEWKVDDVHSDDASGYSDPGTR